MSTMNSGVSALKSFTTGLEVVGNNIANVNTTGFKASQAKYSDSFSNILQRSSASTAARTNSPTSSVGTGVQVASISTNFGQGSLTSTGRDTDLGVSGNGFFKVKNSVDGAEYVTRAGDFRWDDQGFLVTSQGYRVQGLTGNALGTVGDIKLSEPPTGAKLQAATFDRAGKVVEVYSDGTSAIKNQVLLQDFKDPSALTAYGNNLFTDLASAGPAGALAGSTALQVGDVNAAGKNGLGVIQAGTLELSNVDLTDQFSNLITTQRAFQAGSRLISVSDSVLEEIVNLKRG
ncbi:MAG: hypothetical protein RL077_77 [Verrucomicrobiota bacterium]